MFQFQTRWQWRFELLAWVRKLDDSAQKFKIYSGYKAGGAHLETMAAFWYCDRINKTAVHIWSLI